ncbi:hypothetical protein GF325_02170 [Candidatus Bathyarchaeota archaeon]|nr:hypothetical protein [Candidatus Bathyarchaeota archaeon]
MERDDDVTGTKPEFLSDLDEDGRDVGIPGENESESDDEGGRLRQKKRRILLLIVIMVMSACVLGALSLFIGQ